MNLRTADLLRALQRASHDVVELHGDLDLVGRDLAVRLASAAGLSLDRLPAHVLDLAVEACAALELPGPDGRRRLAIPSNLDTTR